MHCPFCKSTEEPEDGFCCDLRKASFESGIFSIKWASHKHIWVEAQKSLLKRIRKELNRECPTLKGQEWHVRKSWLMKLLDKLGGKK
jgi:hypothetical protein